jgi:predicted amidohydrolase
MRIAIAQARGQIDDPPANASKAKMLLNNTDVDLLIFPEMFSLGFDKNCVQYADNIQRLFRDKLNKHTKEKGCHVLFGSPVKIDGKLYNCAVLTDGENDQVYKKIHLDANERFSEKDIFEAGNVPEIFKWRDLKLGIAIGNDIMFGELFRWYAANDVDIVICISAVSKPILQRYEKILQARCVENSVEMIFVNMVGPDPGFVMAGGSRYVLSDGTVSETCTDSSDVRIIKLDAERIKRSKEGRTLFKEIRKDINWSV